MPGIDRAGKVRDLHGPTEPLQGEKTELGNKDKFIKKQYQKEALTNKLVTAGSNTDFT